MDRVIEKKKWTGKKIMSIAAAIILASVIVFAFFRNGKSQTTIDKNTIRIAEVIKSDFQEFIPADGMVVPVQSIYLDALVGGKVETIFVEDGAFVKAGDTLAKLANPGLQLDYMNKETQMIDIMNNLQNTQLSLKQNAINQKKELLEIKYQASKAQDTWQRSKQLWQKKAITEQQYQEDKRNYHYLQNKVVLTEKALLQDSIATVLQMKQLKESVKRMNRNLAMIQENLQNLYILAPIAGQLSSLNLEIGELKTSGDRLGQIDILNSYKIKAHIDERYISRTQVGQISKLERRVGSIDLKITKIYPEVQGGKFEIDLVFADKNDIPSDIKRGQNVQLKLLYGTSAESLLLKKGGYFHDTGGKWVYVLDKDGKAIKTPITIGKQNAEYYELLDGLQEGNRVIISSYKAFDEKDELILEAL